MATFLLNKTTYPATGVDHAIEAHFFSLTEKNIIIVQSNELHVYSIQTSNTVQCAIFPE